MLEAMRARAVARSGKSDMPVEARPSPPMMMLIVWVSVWVSMCSSALFTFLMSAVLECNEWIAKW